MPRSRADEHPESDKDQTKIDESKGYVRYIGLSQVRSISQEDLDRAGINRKNLVDLSWDRSNNWTLLRAAIPDEVYERAIVPDLELILVDGKGNKIR
jgi:hypothetical protein